MEQTKTNKKKKKKKKKQQQQRKTKKTCGLNLLQLRQEPSCQKSVMTWLALWTFPQEGTLLYQPSDINLNLNVNFNPFMPSVR